MNIDKKILNSSIYAVELTAIKEAILWIINYNSADDFAIFFDSLSVLTSLKAGQCKARPNLYNELLLLLNKLTPNKVKFVWVPSHVDIQGNEKADQLSKEALNLETINSTNYLEMEEITSLIKPFIINKWQIQYNTDNKGHFYKSFQVG